MISLLLVVCLHTSFIYMAPLQVQLLQPMLQPQQSLQRQLMALQQLQMLKRLNGLQYPSLDLPRPLLILLPKHKTANTDKIQDVTNLRNQDLKKKHGIEDDERDSIVIDADSTETHNLLAKESNAVLLMPNDGRFSLGDFISSIPFLPIEINVPDSISWIYNEISSIISGFGQRLPFRPQTLDALESMNQNEGNMRIQSLNTRENSPILVIPMGQSFPMYK